MMTLKLSRATPAASIIPRTTAAHHYTVSLQKLTAERTTDYTVPLPECNAKLIAVTT